MEAVKKDGRGERGRGIIRKATCKHIITHLHMHPYSFINTWRGTRRGGGGGGIYLIGKLEQGYINHTQILKTNVSIILSGPALHQLLILIPQLVDRLAVTAHS